MKSVHLCVLSVALCALIAPRAWSQNDLGGMAADAELVETRAEVPKLAAAGAYAPKDNVVEIELSEYAGYAGLIAANGGLEPNDNSVFTKKYGIKVKLSLSEEESWSALNSGKLAASATTADVLAVYGRQFQVVVPTQIGFSRGADGLIVRSDIKKVNALKGKVLATAQFTEADFFIRYLAGEAGLGVTMLPDLKGKPDPEKVNLVYCADAFGAGDLFLRDLKSGRNRLAGCVTWAPKTTEVVEGSGGKAHMLVSNRNLLIIGDILVVNKGFAQQFPEMVKGLVAGLIEGNVMVRTNPEAHFDVIGKAFKWEKDKTKSELAKVHLANGPESLAFLTGNIDSAGSFGGIYFSAMDAYGREFLKNPPSADRFVELKHLQALEQAGAFKDQKALISPLKTGAGPSVEGDPLLSKDIRFFFETNSSKLDMQKPENTANLEAIKRLLQVSPGSTVLLRGHVDNSMIPEFRKKGGEQLVRSQGLRAVQLSEDRAKEIRRLLTEKHGVAADRIETFGAGWNEPVNPNALDDAQREQNRRVEVQWFTLE